MRAAPQGPFRKHAPLSLAALVCKKVPASHGPVASVCAGVPSGPLDRLQHVSESLAVLFGGQGRRSRGSSGWKSDGLASELAKLGLRVKEVPSDGNCFFSALCDQLEVRRMDTESY